MNIPILFEDGEALIVYKPAGLPLDRPRKGGVALEDFLPDLRLGFAREPLPVHRLDQDTSGCLLLARNPKAHKRFCAAFEARVVSKRYLGVVNGPVRKESGTISLNLLKTSSKYGGWRMVASHEGKPAVTHWRKIAEVDGLTLVEFRPETGRTHQIRVHAQKGLGAALLGDPIYGDGAGAGRTMLHAAELTVLREGKPPIHAVAPMPEDFIELGFEEGMEQAKIWEQQIEEQQGEEDQAGEDQGE